MPLAIWGGFGKSRATILVIRWITGRGGLMGARLGLAAAQVLAQLGGKAFLARCGALVVCGRRGAGLQIRAGGIGHNGLRRRKWGMSGKLVARTAKMLKPGAAVMRITLGAGKANLCLTSKPCADNSPRLPDAFATEYGREGRFRRERGWLL